MACLLVTSSIDKDRCEVEMSCQFVPIIYQKTSSLFIGRDIFSFYFCDICFSVFSLFMKDCTCAKYRKPKLDVIEHSIL